MIENFEGGGSKVLRLMTDGNQDIFRYGLSKYEDSQFEDPTFIGFTLEIDNTSALFTDVLPFLEKHSNTRREMLARIPIYNQFISKVQQIFSSQESVADDFDKSRFIKQHYINNISGLQNLTKKFNVWKEDKLEIELNEDIALYTSYLAYLYNNLTYSYENGRELIPENLLKFNLYIKMSEIRNLTSVGKIQSGNFRDQQIVNALKNNVTCITYKLYDCQFNFMDSRPFDDSIEQAGIDGNIPASAIVNMEIFFKSVSRQIFNPLISNAIAMNDNKIDLDLLIVGTSGSTSPTGQTIDPSGNLLDENGNSISQPFSVDSQSQYNKEAFLNDNRNPSSLNTLDTEDTEGVSGMTEKQKEIDKLIKHNEKYNIDEEALNRSVRNLETEQDLIDQNNVIADPLGSLVNNIKTKAEDTVKFEKERQLRALKRRRNELFRVFLGDLERDIGLRRISPENVNEPTPELLVSIERLRNAMGSVVFDTVIGGLTGN